MGFALKIKSHLGHCTCGVLEAAGPLFCIAVQFCVCPEDGCALRGTVLNVEKEALLISIVPVNSMESVSIVLLELVVLEKMLPQSFGPIEFELELNDPPIKLKWTFQIFSPMCVFYR